MKGQQTSKQIRKFGAFPCNLCLYWLFRCLTLISSVKFLIWSVDRTHFILKILFMGNGGFFYSEVSIPATGLVNINWTAQLDHSTNPSAFCLSYCTLSSQINVWLCYIKRLHIFILSFNEITDKLLSN